LTSAAFPAHSLHLALIAGARVIHSLLSRLRFDYAPLSSVCHVKVGVLCPGEFYPCLKPRLAPLEILAGRPSGALARVPAGLPISP